MEGRIIMDKNVEEFIARKDERKNSANLTISIRQTDEILDDNWAKQTK